MDCLTADITNFNNIVIDDTTELVCAELSEENVLKNSESIANKLLCRTDERLSYLLYMVERYGA